MTSLHLADLAKDALAFLNAANPPKEGEVMFIQVTAVNHMKFSTAAPTDDYYLIHATIFRKAVRFAAFATCVVRNGEATFREHLSETLARHHLRQELNA